MAIVRLERELTEALGRKVDLLTEAVLSPYFRETIERNEGGVWSKMTPFSPWEMSGGVTQSGIYAAKALLNCRKRDLLKQNGPSLTFLPTEDVSQWPEI